MSDPSQFAGLQAEADHNRIAFLRTELATCFTFIDVAETERNIGNHEHAERALVDAQKAYNDDSAVPCRSETRQASQR